MGFVSDLVGGVGDAVGSVASGIGDAVGGVGDALGGAVDGIANAVSDNPLLALGAIAAPFALPMLGPGVIGAGLGEGAAGAGLLDALPAAGMAATGEVAPWLSGAALDGALGSGMYGIGDAAIGSSMGLGLGDGALGALGSGFAGVPLSDLGFAGSFAGSLGADQGMNEWNKFLQQDSASPGSFWDQNMTVPTVNTGGAISDFLSKYGPRLGNQALRGMLNQALSPGNPGAGIPQVQLPMQQPLNRGPRSGYDGLTPTNIADPFGNIGLTQQYGEGEDPYNSGLY